MTRNDWARYVFASIAYYFKEIAGDLNLPVLVEGLDERTETFMGASDRIEIRITGPYERELSKDYFNLLVDTSILLVSRFDRKNPYDLMLNAGVFAGGMFESIPVWNFGNQPGDYIELEPSTQIQLGCLSFQQGRGVEILHHGQVSPVEKIRMSEVNCKLMMEIKDE